MVARGEAPGALPAPMTSNDFAALYARCYSRARQQARRVLKDSRGLVEDAIQNAVLVLYPQLDALKSPAADSLFIFACYYEAIHLRTYEQREVSARQASMRESLEASPIKGELVEDPFQVLEVTERAIEAEELRQGMLAWAELNKGRLCEKQIEVLDMRMKGRTWAEIAQHLGCDMDRVQHIRREAGRRLRQLWIRRGPHADVG